MEAIIYNKEGKEAGKIKLPKAIFGLSWNADLVHQVVVSMQANKRNKTANVKDRSEVSGGGKKPWKQKGTGRARHGSRRSPIWVGGGITHGPSNERSFEKKINKKMRAKALYVALSRKLKDNELFFVDSFSFDAPKTKDASLALQKIGKAAGFKKNINGKKKTANIFVWDLDEVTDKSLRNIPSIAIGDAKDINAFDILERPYVIIVNPEKTLEFLTGKLSKK